MGVAAMYLLNFEIIFSPFPRRVLQKLIRSWELLFCLFSSRQVGAVFVGWGLNAHPVICFDITLIGQPRLFTSLSGRLFSGAFILEKEKQFSCKQCYLLVFNQTANYNFLRFFLWFTEHHFRVGYIIIPTFFSSTPPRTNIFIRIWQRLSYFLFITTRIQPVLLELFW